MTKWNQKRGGKWLNEQKRKKVEKDYKKQKQAEKRGPGEKKANMPKAGFEPWTCH